jgi:hypothetical protein
VSVQILARTSIEGYSLQGLAGPWHDPLLSSHQFSTSARPAIVIATNFDQRRSLFMIQVVSVARGTRARPAIPAKGVSGHITLSSCHLRPPDGGAAVVIQPAWLIPDTYCYAFPRAPWFYCLRNQVCTRARTFKRQLN